MEARKGQKLTAKRVAMGVREAKRDGLEVSLWCIEPRGFGCRIRPSGIATFIFQYRTRGGPSAKSRKLSIGRTTTYSLEEARALARKHSQTVAEGGDPQWSKLEASAIPTLSVLFEIFAEHSAKRLSPKTLQDMRGHLKGALKPLAQQRIDVIRKAHVATLHLRLKNTPYAANRALATLSSLYGFAERMEFVEPGGNPARNVPRFKEKHRSRLLDADEIVALWRGLIEVQGQERHRFAAMAIMLGMLTGWRVGEVRGLEWARVDFKRHEVVLDGKTGLRTAPLPSSTHRLMTYLHSVSAHYGRGEHLGRYVFPSTAGAKKEAGPLSDWEHDRTWRKVVAEAGVKNVRRHDLRHLIAGVVGMQTGSALRVKEAMGHSSVAMSERYVAPINDLQRHTVDQAAALVLEIAQQEGEALLQA